MISFLKTWISQIIVAVIIATIIEMILPNGNNKKYIKMIIGMYVLFSIIQPVVTKNTRNNLGVTNFNYKKYFDEDIIESSTQDFENNNSKLIKQAYINNIKEDIVQKLKQKGYKVVECNIEILDDENNKNYGSIRSINLTVNELFVENEENDYNENNINIQNVEINISNNTTETTNKEINNISDKEKQEIIKYLSEEYSINKTDIIIN